MKELHEMELPGVICLDLSEVMGATHSYEPFNTDPNQQIDAYAEGNPATERIKLCLCRQVLVFVTCRRDSGRREIYGGDELDKILQNYF